MEQELARLRQEIAGLAVGTAYFMRRAEKHIAQGETELAKACLVLLCEQCSNYEESLEYFNLTEAWLKHRHLVEGLVKPSIPFNSIQPRRPQKCALQIEAILALPADDLLSALSDHLREMSANGSCISYLNKWERTVFYADELWMEVNSGGFDSYLNDHGQHFEKAYHAFEAIGATRLLSLLDRLQSKFPRSRVPKSMDALQNVLERMEEKGIDFEAEDDWFYENGEKELNDCLLAYVLENRKRFR